MPSPCAAEIATRLAEAELVEFRRRGRRVEALGLVDDDDDVLAALAQRLRDEVVRRREAVARVDQEQDAVGFLDGAQRLPRHQLLDAAARLDQAAGVDDDVGNRLRLLP